VIISQTEYIKRKLKQLTRDAQVPEMLRKGWGLCTLCDQWVQKLMVDADTGVVVGCDPCTKEEA